MKDYSNAEAEVKEMYNNLLTVATEIVDKKCNNSDKIIKTLSKNVDTLTNEDLRKYLVQLSIEGYSISVYKEYSSLQNDCANALYKEGLAKTYTNTQGTVENKKQTSILENDTKQIVNILYSNVTNLLKTKADEIHRIVNTISNVLISRSADAKLEYNPRSESINDNDFTINV